MNQKLDPSCKEWNQSLLALLLADPPDVVVSIGTRFLDDKESIPDGYRTYFEALSEAGISVVAVRAAPLLPFDAPACVDTQALDSCFVSREDRFVSLPELSVPEWSGFTFVDMVDAYCGEDLCPVVDGDIMMYRDKAHLTNTWITERGGAVTKAVEAAITARPTQ